MLCLSQRVSEKVIIKLPDGREMVIMVIALRGDRVRIGYDAPRDIDIVRENAHNKNRRKT